MFPETFVPYYPYFSFIAPAVAMGKDHLRLYEWAPEVPGPAPIPKYLGLEAGQQEIIGE